MGTVGRRDAFDPQSLGQPFGQALQRDLTVAELGTLVDHDDPDTGPEAFQQTCALAGAEDGRPGHIKDQLHPGVGGIGVLASRSPTGTEAPLELAWRDDQVPPDF